MRLNWKCPVSLMCCLTLLAITPARTASPAPRPAAEASSSLKRVEVFFSPKGGCTDVIVQTLRRAQKRIRIQAYSFTSQPIAKAIIEARKRGVDVTAVLDKSNRSSKYSAATFLKNQGATVLIDEAHAIAHNKIILIDDSTIITGSFNFTAAAESSNAENLLLLTGDTKLFAKYDANFAEHLKHSKPYDRLSLTPAANPIDAAEDEVAKDSTVPTEQNTGHTGPNGETQVGRTATGTPIYEGPHGGPYHYNASGKKVYEKK